MTKFSILSVIGFFLLLLTIGGCVGEVVVPPTPTPTPASTPAPDTGSISGIVTEEGTGVPLADVSISVDGILTTTTGVDGSYSITGLTPGFHTLKFEKEGYGTETENVEVVAGVDTSLAMELEDTRVTTLVDISNDTFIVSGSSTVYGSSSLVVLGAYTATEEGRILVKFPNPLPAGAKVISAKLKLYKISGMGGASLHCSVYPITEDWDQTSAEWYIRIGGFPWFTEGGTYDNTQLVGSADIPTAGIFDWEEIEIKDAFAYWKTNDNYGLIIIPEVTTFTRVDFYSYEASSNKPYVEVEYYIP